MSLPKPPLLAASLAIIATLAVSGTDPRPEQCPQGTQPIHSARAQQGGRYCSKLVPRELEAKAPSAHPLLRGPAPDPAVFRGALHDKAGMEPLKAVVPKANGDWQPYAQGGLISGRSIYSARVDNFAYDEDGKRLFAAVGTGGIWMSEATDGDIRTLGDHWVSVGEKLPSQINGGVIWTPAGGGTLVAAGGESVMGNNGYMGLGAHWSTDLGQSWTRATGFPDGVQVYNARRDPGNPQILYIASSIGLYRSEDAGRSFVNVRLPTTPDCAGNESISSPCQFANVVTDVVIKAPGGSTGEVCDPSGCPVVAAVGWRAGQATFPDGTVMAPANGLYRSATGARDSFVAVDDEPVNALLPQGFAPRARTGRIEMGAASGPDQDHNYLYAIVQDSVNFNEGYALLDPILDDLLTLPLTTAVHGIFVSADFGESWFRMANDDELIATVGSLSFLPGVQTWYNEWIAVDPTRQLGGIPTRMTFGMEEVFQNTLTRVPLNGILQAGLLDFTVIGRYFELGLPGESTTTHPDQHVGLYLPDGEGGVCLFAGGDGGVFKQCVAANEEMDNTKWGAGANEGFYALLPYGLAVAKDGTVWQGHQDNGSGHIEPDTREQFQDFGADGFFAEVDPDNSDVSYTESQNGGLRRTTDRGASSTSIAPSYTRVNFANWFVMDPLDAQHMLTGAQEIYATLNAETVTSSSWVEVFNLGTNPDTGAIRTTTTMHVHGPHAYVGYCGDCGVTVNDTGFANGIATNVGGTEAPEKGSAKGWHFAKAQGLDSRFIAGIEMDESDPKTIYVTLAGYASNIRPAGSYKDPNAAKIGSGVVFKSTDAGESFTDISGNLPRAQTNTVVLHRDASGRGQLIVGTDIGPFISSDTEGSNWAPLGNQLPNVPVVMLRMKPKASAEEPDMLFAATHGRGIWSYELPKLIVDPPPSGGGGSDNGGDQGRYGGSLGGLSLLGLLSLLALRRGRRGH